MAGVKKIYWFEELGENRPKKLAVLYIHVGAHDQAYWAIFNITDEWKPWNKEPYLGLHPNLLIIDLCCLNLTEIVCKYMQSSKISRSAWIKCYDMFLKVGPCLSMLSWSLVGLCSNNRSSQGFDGAEAQSNLCRVTWWPRNICSPSSLNTCGMKRSFPGDFKLLVCFSFLHLSASSFLTLANLLIFLYLDNLPFHLPLPLIHGHVNGVH